ncbi:MAG: Rrf2 family transcriptional regulator [Candidatus Omnitrophica bacterium]|nr:Rrf2 family transcriptional regulator [Candidatus Omnitrophota bacterium]MBU1852910.1 Rrf2 family transcriptional regulator [Candidatus Omnitrophota bacterium]
MKFISRDTDYTMRALVFMASSSKKGAKHVITVDEIVDELGLPKIFMRRTLQKLARHKILSSYKGKEGGFSLLKSASQISLVDIIKIFQGNIDLTNCLLRGKVCPEVKKCPLRKRLKKIGQSLNKELNKITVASLL